MESFEASKNFASLIVDRITMPVTGSSIAFPEVYRLSTGKGDSPAVERVIYKIFRNGCLYDGDNIHANSRECRIDFKCPHRSQIDKRAKY